MGSSYHVSSRVSLTDARYLEQDPSTTVLERRRRLQGYELYVVEQWACSRIHPTFVITTYTGLEHHSVVVSVLSVPTNEDLWSPRLRVYFNAITQFHARKKETPLGTLMVTNLSGFPSALNVIAVPDGDVKKHRADFTVNENLKRMGCSGRAGLNLTPPIEATRSKFIRLYKISDRIPVDSAVIELVKLCQGALLLFGKLAPEYADGLLCDLTEQAINDWWSDIGMEFFNVDPTDGILGPTTVAALLGILLGARNRLHACGAPVGKDVFDVVSTKRGIGSFQKSQKLKRSRRLDRHTLERLHRASAKAASGQGWTVPRAVKSTVAELSGRGEELVTGMAGIGDKVGIADVETLDIETFVQLANGERCKWLWYGKPRKNQETAEALANAAKDEVLFSNTGFGDYSWDNTRHDTATDDDLQLVSSSRKHHFSALALQANADSTDKDSALRRNVLKSVTGKITDARSGLGRIKDAVGRTGFRGHYHRYSKDELLTSDGDSMKENSETKRLSLLAYDPRTEASQPKTIPVTVDKGFSEQYPSSRRGSSLPEEIENAKANIRLLESHEQTIDTDADSISSFDSLSRDLRLEDHRLNHLYVNDDRDRKSIVSLDSVKRAQPSTASNLRVKKLERVQELSQEPDDYMVFKRRKSHSDISERSLNNSYGYRWPRHLSFSAVVDVVCASSDDGPFTAGDLQAGVEPEAALVTENSLSFHAQLLGESLDRLRDQVGFWTEEKVDHVNAYETQAQRDQESLENIYRQKLDEHHELMHASEVFLAEEKSSLTEDVKQVEYLGAKLEYELSALQSRVEDFETGVAEFERQVLQVELKAVELDEERTDQVSWFGWVLSVFTGNTKRKS